MVAPNTTEEVSRGSIHPRNTLNTAEYAGEKLEISPLLEVPPVDLNQQYSILEQFAEGGIATVSIARDLNLRRAVAVKSPKHTGKNDTGKFISEAKVTAQLDHPGIIPVYGISSDKNHRLYLSMKLVNGKTLREYLYDSIESNLKNSDFDEDADLRKRLEFFLRVCDALSYAHSRKILHRDLKPENIMIGEYMEVYVMDWGMAKFMNDQPKFTVSVSGTPRYFAPELLEGKPYDLRSEIFTLGLILQEIVTLKYAIPGKDDKECVDNLNDWLIEPVEHLMGHPIDRPLAAIIEKATAKKPENRYASVEELAKDLRDYMGGFPVSAYRENAFSRFSRWMIRNRNRFLTGVLILISVSAAVTAFSVYRELKTSQEMHNETAAMNYIFNRAAVMAGHLDLTALQIQEQLMALARISAYLLSHNSPTDNGWQKSFRPPLADIGKTERGMFVSPYYHRLIAMDYGIYTFAPGADRERCMDFLRKTSPVLRKMRNIVLGSMSGYNFDPKDYARLQITYLNSGFPVRSVYVGTEDGLKLLYPWRGSYPRDIDPRQRSWYRSAREKRGPVWGHPYMDFDSISGLSIPCAVPIIDFENKFRGVAGLDLSVNKLTERILGRGNRGEYVIEKAVIDRTGETIFSSLSKFYNKKFDPDKFHRDTKFKIGPFRTRQIRDKILNTGRKYGAFIEEQDGKKIICSFADLEVWGMVFVVVADYEKLITHIQNEKK